MPHSSIDTLAEKGILEDVRKYLDKYLNENFVPNYQFSQLGEIWERKLKDGRRVIVHLSEKENKISVSVKKGEAEEVFENYPLANWLELFREVNKVSEKMGNSKSNVKTKHWICNLKNGKTVVKWRMKNLWM